ncbi:MAG TPA: hypothetical protein VNI61_11645 [Gemmatimonadales bacterium]|nr:hypothetical protein [Gemmatimonadales bacterium]
MLALTLDTALVCSPDTLTGVLRAEDPDGLDSLWLTVDENEVGVDGGLREVFESRFRMPIRAGLNPGATLEVVLRGRDLAGFSDTLRRSVGVTRCDVTT